LGRLAQRTPNRSCGGAAAPLGESQERHARLRLPTEPARFSVGVLGLPELASQAMDFSLPVKGLGGGGPVEAPRKAFPGAPCLLQSVAPVPVELHDLGPVHETAAREGNEIGLLLTPTGQDRSPLPCPAELVHLLACQDDPAVDDPHRDRRHPPAGDCHHRLVQESEALLDAACADQHAALRLNGEREALRVAEALGDGGRVGRDGGSGCEVTAGFVLEHERHEQVASLDRVLLPEDPVGAPEPPAGRTHLSAKGEIDADPDRAPNCAAGLARLQVGVMSALEDPQVLVVPAEHVRGRGQQLEILSSERSGPVGV
jgi:hypothetical protein